MGIENALQKVAFRRLFTVATYFVEYRNGGGGYNDRRILDQGCKYTRVPAHKLLLKGVLWMAGAIGRTAGSMSSTVSSKECPMLVISLYCRIVAVISWGVDYLG